MDDIDRAQIHEEEMREAAIERACSNTPRGVSATVCEECGARIPEARRQAVPGCRLCVECQSYYEMIWLTGG